VLLGARHDEEVSDSPQERGGRNGIGRSLTEKGIWQRPGVVATTLQWAEGGADNSGSCSSAQGITLTYSQGKAVSAESQRRRCVGQNRGRRRRRGLPGKRGRRGGGQEVHVLFIGERRGSKTGRSGGRLRTARRGRGAATVHAHMLLQSRVASCGVKRARMGQLGQGPCLRVVVRATWQQRSAAAATWRRARAK
jgi:hypothetical protein